MYIIFGILAAVTTDIFLYSSLRGQEPKWYLFVLGLSITALENRSWVNDICMRTLFPTGATCRMSYRRSLRSVRNDCKDSIRNGTDIMCSLSVPLPVLSFVMERQNNRCRLCTF